MKYLSTPYRVEVALTSRCNLRCRYCYFYDQPEVRDDELSTAEWLRIFAELGAMKVFNLTLSGGEVLLRDDLEELILGVCRNNMRFNFLSNGTLFTEETARFLKKTARCNFIQLTLDGLREEHEAGRGAGTFAAVINAIRIIREANIPLHVKIILGKHNAGRLMQTVRFLIDEMKVDRVGTNWLTHFADNALEEVPLQLSHREKLNVLLEAQEVLKVYPGKFSISETGLSYASNRWPEMIRAHRENAPPRTSGDCLNCPAQLEKLSIFADGTVTPCNHLPEHVLGKAGRDSLSEIWHHSPILNAMRQNSSFPANSFPDCMGCQYAAYCRPTASCLRRSGRASAFCLKEYQQQCPDFDFERLAWKNDTLN